MSINRFLWLWIVTLGFLVPVQAQEFKHGQKVPTWGEVVDPDGDCTFKAEKDKLLITVPGTPHDLSFFNPKLSAPRVLQEVTGDFGVQVKVSCDLNPGNVPSVPGKVAFYGAGLLLWDGDQNFLRLERNIWTAANGNSTSYGPLLEHWKGGKVTAHVVPVAAPFFKTPSTWLKLHRRGDKLTVYMSHDGKDYTLVKEFVASFPNQLKVGVAAVNTSAKAFNVQFEEFQLRSAR